MISKGDVVEMAIRKLLGARDATNTGVDSTSLDKALEDLEAMLARWAENDIELFYFFEEEPGKAPVYEHDSGLQLWMKLPVACNLAILIAPDYGLEASATVYAEANRGMAMLTRKCSRVPKLKPAWALPAGMGNRAEDPASLRNKGDKLR